MRERYLLLKRAVATLKPRTGRRYSRRSEPGRCSRRRIPLPLCRDNSQKRANRVRAHEHVLTAAYDSHWKVCMSGACALQARPPEQSCDNQDDEHDDEDGGKRNRHREREHDSSVIARSLPTLTATRENPPRPVVPFNRVASGDNSEGIDRRFYGQRCRSGAEQARMAMIMAPELTRGEPCLICLTASSLRYGLARTSDLSGARSGTTTSRRSPPSVA